MVLKDFWNFNEKKRNLSADDIRRSLKISWGKYKYNKISTKDITAGFTNQWKYHQKEADTASEYAYKFLTDMCRMRLKKFLSRTVWFNEEKYDITELFIRMIISLSFVKENKYQLSDKEIIALFDVLREDYLKEKRITQIVKSIELKNVSVQVDNSENMPKLVLSSYLNDNNKINKKVIFEFIRDFANGNIDVQNKMVSHIRALILLYVCGKEAYENAEYGNMPAWGWGKYLPEESANFSEDAFMEYQNLIQLKDRKFKSKTNDKESWNLKNEIKESQNKIKEFLAQKITDNYRIAAKTVDNRAYDIFWIKYIQLELTKQVRHNMNTTAKFGSAYICKTIFKEWVSYVAKKFVDMGKAVFHFAMPSPYENMNDVSFGHILPQYRKGITSFDYEAIKANENLTRNFAISATFAGTVFSNNAVNTEFRSTSDNEDVLYYKDEILINNLRNDARMRILQFFGGASHCETIDTITSDLACAIKNALSIVRNHSYHYSSQEGLLNPKDLAIIEQIFNDEFSRTGIVFASRYYSNNVPVFYGIKSVKSLMTHLYAQSQSVPAQIPSFQNILARKEADTFIRELIPDSETKIHTIEEIKKFRSSVYYVLKEIYYNAFLQEGNIKKLFIDVLKADKNRLYKLVDKNNKDKKIVNENNAVRDFANRINELENLSFGELCQSIMTEVNFQNQGNLKVKSSKEKDRDKKNGKGEIYQHYKMLLWKYIREAFLKYIKDNKKYSFLKELHYDENFAKKVTVNDFCDGWSPLCFNNLKKKILNSSTLMSWFITAHFLTAKQLNHLKGDIKEYKQYITNIDTRAKSVNKEYNIVEKNHLNIYDDLIEVLEFVNLFAGKVTNERDDYFESKREYINYLNNFFTFDISQNSSVAKGKFLDEENPILNRGIVYSKMYGMDNVMTKIGYKVDKQEFADFVELENSEEIKNIFNKVACENIEEQKLLNRFQQIKNRIELTDLLTLESLLIDCLSQLVSYAYLRERDLMYFQLGINYLRLYHGDSILEDSKYRTFELQNKNIHIKDGALLYQIMAMYTPDIPIFKVRKNGKVEIADITNAGTAMKVFSQSYCHDEHYETYVNGLELFAKMHGKDSDMEFSEAVNLRKAIDHMKYLVNDTRSIMDYYSEIYNKFFRYDTSLRKSVSYILPNIVMRYFIEMKTAIDKHQIKAGAGQINITDLQATDFVYKFNGVNDPKNNSLKAKSDKFVELVRNLLELREK